MRTWKRTRLIGGIVAVAFIPLWGFFYVLTHPNTKSFAEGMVSGMFTGVLATIPTCIFVIVIGLLMIPTSFFDDSEGSKVRNSFGVQNGSKLKFTAVFVAFCCVAVIVVLGVTQYKSFD